MFSLVYVDVSQLSGYCRDIYYSVKWQFTPAKGAISLPRASPRCRFLQHHNLVAPPNLRVVALTLLHPRSAPHGCCAGFAKFNLRVFRAFARLPPKFITCHDDNAKTVGRSLAPRGCETLSFRVRGVRENFQGFWQTHHLRVLRLHGLLCRCGGLWHDWHHQSILYRLQISNLRSPR